MRYFIERALKKLAKLTRDQVEELLIQSAGEIDRLETVMNSLTEGVLVCDQNHNLILTNKYAEHYLPIGAYEPGGQPVWASVRDDTIAEFLEHTLRNGDKALDREFTVEIKGIRRLLSVSVLPLVKDGHVTGSLVHVQEITERKTREARLRRAENLASLTTLAAGVAHEIKNPLGSISIHIQLIQKAIKKLPRNQRGVLDKYLSVVNEEIDRLNHIVVDFLFAVRPMNIEVREGDINALIQDLVDFVRFELEAAHIETRLDLAGDLASIEFDERYMKQALLNLIKNAMAAMDSGGVLSIKTEASESEVYIHISDTGVGIPEENLSKIFEPYYTTKESGSGLGLTLVFKIIKEHQGEITVNSKEGKGTSFQITLPLPRTTTRLISYTRDTAGEDGV
ncbi:MAG: PAS domain S-box protein [Spirochaetaceae bacterium]|jgi:PAS domain S-box-containing protein|nr:PAS domain S-box protein [Spirochaetaceae bacterium]